MQNNNSFMTPISSFFMIIAVSPYIGMRFGHISLILVAPFILHSVFNAYQFYKNKAFEERITFAEALEDDLPNMSPMHFVLFLIISAPVFLLITGGKFEGLIGIALLWTIYTIYYYGFRKK